MLEQDQLAAEQGGLGGQALGRRRDGQQPLLVGQVDLEAGGDQVGGGDRVVGDVDRLGLLAGHPQQGGDVAGEQPARLDRALLGRLPGRLGELAHLGHDVRGGLGDPVDPEPAQPARPRPAASAWRSTSATSATQPIVGGAGLDLAALDDRHHPEAALGVQDPLEHLPVAVLEHMQRDRQTGVQHGLQREQRKLHRDNLMGRVGRSACRPRRARPWSPVATGLR